jgi:DNA-binding transcriptional LysR family regulator
MKNLHNVDLRLLQLMVAVREERNLSRAALRLGLTQPAVSQALARLRQHFGDPLFVRSGGSMDATPFGAHLCGLAAAAATQLEDLLSARLEFDPANHERSFRIAMTDVGQVVILPKLLQALAQLAPHTRVNVSPFDPESSAALEGGNIDLALGFLPEAAGSFVQRTLFQESFVCLVRAGHPRLGKRMTVSQYLAEQHAIVQTPGTGHGMIDRHLARLGMHRMAGVETPNFIGLAAMVAGTDLVATLPRRAAELLALDQQVRVLPMPVAIPSYPVRLQWHARMQQEPGHLWLRNLIVELFRKS